MCAARYARGGLRLQGKWRTRACVPHIPYHAVYSLLTKGRLVLEVVRKYCKDNPETNFTQLSQIFPKKLQGPTNGVLNIFGELKDYQKEGKFYIKNGEIIQLKNGEQIAVCSQWGKDNLDNFIEHITQTLGYEIVAQ